MRPGDKDYFLHTNIPFSKLIKVLLLSSNGSKFHDGSTHISEGITRKKLFNCLSYIDTVDLIY